MSNTLTAEALSALAPGERGETLVITVGNPFRCDDGVGPFIGGRLLGRRLGFRLINAFDRPESAVDEAVGIKPAKVIFIDAADFGGLPGEVKVIAVRSIPESSLSTHSIPLSVVAGIIGEDTRAQTVFLGIQTRNTGYGEELSPEVEASARLILGCLKAFGLYKR
ncbi:MAG: hydrogenase maturation protease [Elusimicrobiota bacterium]|nr:hydrogenase maturation protease [Elusimicrobiota bacterium]